MVERSRQKDAIGLVRQEREGELARFRDRCGRAKAKVKEKCSAGRGRIRAKARGRIAEIERDPDDAPPVRAMSQKENDSLAEHAVPRELRAIWRQEKKRYSYEMAPDMRAEQFLEWAEAHAEEVIERQARRTRRSDKAMASEYARHEREHDERASVDDVPF